MEIWNTLMAMPTEEFLMYAWCTFVLSASALFCIAGLSCKPVFTSNTVTLSKTTRLDEGAFDVEGWGEAVTGGFGL